MLKKTLILLGLLVLGVITWKMVTFYQTGVFHGNGSFSRKSYENLTVNGSANCFKVTVNGTLKVYGSADLSQSKVGSLVTHGPTTLKDTTIGDLSKISGSLNVQNSTLNNVSISSTNNIKISNSKTKSIRVKSKEWKFDDPSIVLINTIVDGDIAFYGANGKVYLEGNSRITGNVSGGKIIKK